ncbi:hypothetical protein GCK72_007885 [Caenorhabditis remanei]|uniref:DUF38 domain-containing protein n=1 Tax=Caenorhabditis remanei TaxID=31234 RepID=A0A6A5HK79_CAERE|nr:hypothetical protein GCK72_007885 [Caenorhabditis remanei]KAF1767925.1 hypothetical protein GCK72_007885 [Caenorhabditis remanei]
MPIPLTYPGFKCVLENLEAVKRAHIIGRAPGLRKIDKLIPLRLKDFSIICDEMTINDWIIRYSDDDEVKFEMNGKTFSRVGSACLEDKMKKLINFFFCGRRIIHVDKLCWFDCSLPEFLPVGMKFRVNSLTAPFLFDNAIPHIDPRSLPLKTLATVANAPILDDPVVQSAETLHLNLVYCRRVPVRDLKKLNNHTVVFEDCNSSRLDMVSLIKYHIETKKNIRTAFVISTCNINVIKEMFSDLELAFGGFQCDLDDVNKRFLVGSSNFSIPINNESGILVYAIEDPEEDCPYKIIVKPVSGL